MHTVHLQLNSGKSRVSQVYKGYKASQINTVYKRAQNVNLPKYLRIARGSHRNSPSRTRFYRAKTPNSPPRSDLQCVSAYGTIGDYRNAAEQVAKFARIPLHHDREMKYESGCPEIRSIENRKHDLPWVYLRDSVQQKIDQHDFRKSMLDLSILLLR